MDDVLIVGAGPTGLALALWLAEQGVGIRIIDKGAGPGETSRAMAVQARTLELYRQLGLADAVIAAGHKNPALNLWARGLRRARLDLADAGAGTTPYPFVLIYPQDRHERLLEERLAELGVTVERRTELLGFDDRGPYVAARLRLPDGAEAVGEARYLAGCDGARSSVRHGLAMAFEGGTYRHVFYVADVELRGLELPDEAHIAFDRGDFLLALAYGAGRHRLIGTVRDERADRAETLTFADVGHDALESLGLHVDRVNWFSTYRVHHRVADTFQRGRVFLLGDAAHIHSPAGGQGMNTGILDAANLAWKLAAVLGGQAAPGLLDTYTLERRAFARKLVHTTDRVFTLATSNRGLADFVKTYVVPSLASAAYRNGGTREFIFRTVSQTTLHYRDSPLSSGKAGAIRGGDRLPWMPPPADNYGPLSRIGWQVHVVGIADPALRAWCREHDLPLHVFDWTPAHAAAGFARDAAYLLRPDTWVALADPLGSPATLEDYFAAQGYGFSGALAAGAPA
jgi:2-polyprenyl-6-methoxyphenol hydroxylase-like FAD-dependent oxidoreductase